MVWALVMVLAMMAFPIAPARQADQSKPIRPSIEAIDSTPLGERMPLLMVHGIAPSDGPNDNWGLYLDAFKTHPGFNDRYKVYLYHYDPRPGVAENTTLFEKQLAEFITENRISTMRLLAHSMGGVLVRNIGGSPMITAHVDRILTINTPFHGTPLTTRDWIIRQTAKLSPMRLAYITAYRITAKKIPHYTRDYCWDNFDWSMPDPTPNSAAREKDCLPPVYDPEANPNTHWVTYGSFFTDNADAQAWLAKQLETPDSLVQELAECKTRYAGLIGARRALVFAREKMSNLDLKPGYMKACPPGERSYAILSFNDGVAPVTSYLWLGRFGKDVLNSAELAPEDALLAALKSTRNNPAVTTRLFAGLDHRDWMTGTTRYKDMTRFNDLLHPEEEPKAAVDWVIEDLMRD